VFNTNVEMLFLSLSKNRYLAYKYLKLKTRLSGCPSADCFPLIIFFETTIMKTTSCCTRSRSQSFSPFCIFVSLVALSSSEWIRSATALLPTAQRPAIAARRGTAWFAAAEDGIATSTRPITNSLEDNLALLRRAADTKQEDSDAVFDALSQLEVQMRQAAKQDASVAIQMLEQLSGDWRLIFTTGTQQTQQRAGRINYFPLKAIQSFQTKDMTIENGIYLGDWPAVRFSGRMEFDMKKRRLSFTFDKIALFGFLDIQLAAGQAEQMGAKSGLGSESNVANAGKDKKAFFNWISADADIATARGGGGGLALWKRVTPV
jgi:hypothetical protein